MCHPWLQTILTDSPSTVINVKVHPCYTRYYIQNKIYIKIYIMLYFFLFLERFSFVTFRKFPVLWECHPFKYLIFLNFDINVYNNIMSKCILYFWTAIKNNTNEKSAVIKLYSFLPKKKRYETLNLWGKGFNISNDYK